MKKIFLIIAATAGLTACHKLDLSDPSGPSTGSFYENQTQLELAVNDLYRMPFWDKDNEFFSDNVIYRQFGNAVINGTMNSEDGSVKAYWLNCYKAIARANAFIANEGKAVGSAPASVITKLEAEMRLIRAYEYSRLITHFGDVPFITQPTSLEGAYDVTRTSKDKILNFIFQELDFASANLPVSYPTSDVRRLTKGLAFAVKARTALYMSKWQEAKVAADSVINLANNGVYSLYFNFPGLFLKDGETSREIIWSVPLDEKQKVYNQAEGWVKEFISRNAGGYGAYFPSFDAIDAFECTDGLPIDKSPLYDPRNPFKNRDPRLTASIVEFGTPWLGFSYQPHPDSLQVRNYKTGGLVLNRDSRGTTAGQFASFTGLLWKKGIDQSWADRLLEDNDVILFRLAEMYLTYAEAKIELGAIDQSVLDAINKVRARGYGVPVTAVGSYPAVKTLDQAELRKIVRRERRVEFMLEGLRYMDLIRWRLAEKVLTKPVYGLVDPAQQKRDKWPFAGVTPLDNDGIGDYSTFFTNGYIRNLLERKFDASRQYLWPIPQVERNVNPNITQNPGY
ncbi:RagB/SusD family nutrient uptake outer membrane protein [Sediminibacterium soli]|uniref:RagB/SusD family nutrient uptake outer membrane protein n=1 Tax=Sediminibacterium soli TaxID=2698829 RepID=UPI001379BE75|nr:RagB/SusD family nutrient uptake outer membrane protein [Sediminibacterium soli]NCI46579.1 RagB/SusD family nutrient uptake outer membrane protein [Sediminibacterium soli]